MLVAIYTVAQTITMRAKTQPAMGLDGGPAVPKGARGVLGLVRHACAPRAAEEPGGLGPVAGAQQDQGPRQPQVTLQALCTCALLP